MIFKKQPPRSTSQVYKGDSGDWPFHFASTNLPHAYKGSRRGTVHKEGADLVVGWAVLW